MSLELKHKAGPKWVVVNSEDIIVKEFVGKKERIKPEFEEWMKSEEAQLLMSEEPATSVEADESDPESVEEEVQEKNPVVLPDPNKLKGRAKTAALNAQVNTTFVESEWTAKSGVVNEANAVFNIPDGWKVAWATPRQIDGGRHANYLRTEMGYRPVYKDEMAADMYEEGLYTSFVDDDSSEFVFKQGAQLFLGSVDRVAKKRNHDYDARMAAFNRKQDSIEASAERQGAQMRTSRDESTYNPMRR